MATKKELYQEKAQAKYDLLNAKIDALKAKYDEAKADAKLEVKNQFDDLSAKQKLVMQKFEDINNAGQEAWQEVMQSLESALESLEGSLADAAETLKKAL